jgi:hypothetical protein
MLWSRPDERHWTMRFLKALRTLCGKHPLIWILIGVPLFMHLARLPHNSWSIELSIARNLVNGYGYVAAPMDPPALWRPPLAVAVLVPIEMLFQDPQIIYRVYGTLTLAGFLASMFYLMRMLGGKVAAHFSQLIILSTPAFTHLVSHIYTFTGYLLLFGMVTLSVLVTLWSWQKATWRRDLLVGLCWGLTFLARPEAMLLFGATAFGGMLLYRRLGVSAGRAVLRLALQVALFLTIYLPSVVIFS